MSVLIPLALYVIVFGLVVAKRTQLTQFFLRKSGGTFRAVLLSGLFFSFLEEGTVNLFGSPVVLLVTVPTLTVILLLVGYGLVRLKPNVSWRKAVVANVFAGLIFELLIGQLGQSLRANGLNGAALVGFALNIFAYTYIAIIPFSILFSPPKDRAPAAEILT